MTHDSAAAIETTFFTGLSLVIHFVDWSYADSQWIAPAQHLLSAIAAIIAIVVGLPVFVKHINKALAYIKSKIKKP